MSSRNSAIYLTTSLPLPSGGGSAMRAAESARSLHRRFDVTVILVGDATSSDVRRSEEYLNGLGISLVIAPQAASHRIGRSLSLAIRILCPAASNLVLRRPPPHVATLLNNASLIWVFRLFPLWKWRLKVSAPLVLDLDDLDENTKSSLPLLRRTLVKRLIRATRRRQLRLADLAVVNSDVDRARLSTKSAVATMPNTYSVPPATHPFQPRTPGSRSAVMIARFDYWPNAEGAQWLIDSVWPLVTDALPDASLRIIGRDGQKLVLPDGLTNVIVSGEVDDLRSDLEEAAVSLVPIFHGSGTRIKILEAFANYIPVVSTPLGAEGLQIIPGHDILLAETPEQFAKAIVEVLSDSERANLLAQTAFAVYDTRYSPRIFDLNLDRIIDETIRLHMQPQLDVSSRFTSQ